MLERIVGWLMMFALATAAHAPARALQSPDSFKTRADALVGVLNGTADLSANFSAGFLAAVPPAQLSAITAQLRGQLGPALRIAAVRPINAQDGTVDVAHERGTLRVRLVIDPAPPHLATGLLVTSVSVAGDDFTKLEAEFAALPGESGFAVSRLGGTTPAEVAAHGGDKAHAVGSAFKLYVLAEAMRAVAAGERRWTDVLPLNRRSLPSGFLHTWPANAPMTLHSLATLMISQSDNSATDTLIAALGRGKIEAMLTTAGHASPVRNAPFLTTSEAFMLKARGGAASLTRWQAADAAGRRTVLEELGKINRERFDFGSFSGLPKAIDTVEWFATPHDLVRVLDWIRRNDRDGTGQAILAINPGIGAAAARHAYLGFKGGSETGVINLSFLVRTKAGAWYAVTGSWNDPAAAVDEARFVGLMSRLVTLAAK